MLSRGTTALSPITMNSAKKVTTSIPPNTLNVFFIQHHNAAIILRLKSMLVSGRVCSPYLFFRLAQSHHAIVELLLEQPGYSQCLYAHSWHLPGTFPEKCSFAENKCSWDRHQDSLAL